MKKYLQPLYVGLVIFLVALNLRPAITSVAPVLDMIQQALGMTNTVASLLTAIPVLCMGIFAPIAGSKLLKRFKQEQLLLATVILLTAGTILRFFAFDALFLLFTTVVIGIGIAVAGPLLSGMIKKYFPKRAALMVSIYSVGLAAGAAVASAFTLPIAEFFGGAWNVALGFWALLGGIAIASLLPLLRSHAVKPVSEAVAVDEVSGRSPWLSKEAWSIALYFGLQSGLFYSLLAWFIPYLKSIGVDANTAGYIMTLFTTVQILGNFCFPLLVSAFKRKMLFLYLSAALTVLGMLVLIILHLGVVAALLLAIGTGGLFSLGLLLPIEVTDNHHDANSYSAMALSVGYIIAGFLPFLLGMAIDFSGDTAVSMNFLTVFALLMFAAIFWIQREAKKKEAKK